MPSKSLRRTSRDRLLAVRKINNDYCSYINVLIVRQEDPDKIQDARGLLKSIGLQTPTYGHLE